LPRFLRTPNCMGWAATELSPLSQQFVDFAARAPGPVLDLGAAPGLASAAVLAAASTAEVIANDLDPSLLTALPAAGHPRLQLAPGRFPRELRFAPASLGAVHASSVFHFLTGIQIAKGLASIAHWLRPGGKLFVQNASPYQTPFAAFLDDYARRCAAGDEWPGWIEHTRHYSSHRLLGQMPKSLHLLDEKTLARSAAAVGLQVERAWLYRRPDCPRELRLDGRESAALIAVKP